MLLFLQALRHAARRLVRVPAFSAAAVLTLCLGIGATTAVFSVVNGVLLQPLPYADADRLVDLGHVLEVSGASHVDQSDASFLHYRRENRVFSDVGAYQQVAVNLGGIAGAAVDPTGTERAAAARVSASLFAVLRAAPLHGRVFAEHDDQPGAVPVVVIAQRLWERSYASDPRLVGRSLRVDGVTREVIGIMPDAFAFPEARTELWLPSGIDPANTESATFGYRAVARLRDGVTLDAAQADLQRLLLLLPEAFPGRLTVPAIQATRMRATARPLRDVVVGDAGRVLWVALGVVAFVLLVACANVANLFLARAEARWREMAVRRALGAGQGALILEFLSEGIVVATVGGTLGVAAAAAGVRVLRLLPQLAGGAALPRLGDVHVDGIALGFAFVLTALTSLLVSVVPAVRALAISRLALGGDRTGTPGRERQLARHALVVSQVALALVLLAGAGVMARSFARLREVPAGFDAAGVTTFRVALPEAAYRTPDDVARFHVRALDALTALPGVRSAAVASKLPLDGAGRADTAVWVEDPPTRPGTIPNIHQVVSITPGYFAAMGIPLLSGRVFEQPEPGRVALEVIVSRSVAERYWPGQSAVGRRIRRAPTSPWSTVVGVAGDVRGTALEQPPDEIVYVPLVTAAGPAADRLWVPRDVALMARVAEGRGSRQDFAAIATAARLGVRSIDPAIPAYALAPMAELVSRASARTVFTLLLLGVASFAALALGAVGIVGVIAYGVSRRTREIGIRLTLGARPAQVRRMVSAQALTVCAVGVVVGLAGAVALTRVLGTLLFETSPTDPAALGGATVLLLGVAVAASWVPTGRAARVDPASVLRAE